SEWQTVDSVSYRYDKETRASILEIEGTADVDWDDDGDGRRSLSLPGGGFSPPHARRRSSDQDQTAPYYSEPAYSCYATTVRFPNDTDTENWGFNRTYDTKLFGRVYYRMMERRDDGTLRMVRGSRVDTPEISVEQAERDNGRLDGFDNSKANLRYNPNHTFEGWGALKPVPATYEMDWTGANVPCLPADLLKLPD
ncbi:MAG: transglutaminase, partial [Pontixanthobacter sp.]